MDQPTMSPIFMKMKHAQETEDLLQSFNNNRNSLDWLKQQQALETQKNLQRLDSVAPYQVSPYAPLSTANPNMWNAYNAQGKIVSDRSTLCPERPNKYRHLKYMSPEMLNQMRGRPVCQNQVLTTNDDVRQIGNLHQPCRLGDVYEQTSYKTQPYPYLGKTSQLVDYMAEREKQILSQKPKGGIQSFNQQCTNMSNIQEAFDS
jgi:hypothetical protein